MTSFSPIRSLQPPHVTRRTPRFGVQTVHLVRLLMQNLLLGPALLHLSIAKTIRRQDQGCDSNPPRYCNTIIGSTRYSGPLAAPNMARGPKLERFCKSTCAASFFFSSKGCTGPIILTCSKASLHCRLQDLKGWNHKRTSEQEEAWGMQDYVSQQTAVYRWKWNPSKHWNCSHLIPERGLLQLPALNCRLYLGVLCSHGNGGVHTSALNWPWTNKRGGESSIRTR